MLKTKENVGMTDGRRAASPAARQPAAGKTSPAPGEEESGQGEVVELHKTIFLTGEDKYFWNRADIVPSVQRAWGFLQAALDELDATCLGCDPPADRPCSQCPIYKAHSLVKWAARILQNI